MIMSRNVAPGDASLARPVALRPHRGRRACSPLLERLEGRALLAAWAEQGPGPILYGGYGGQVEGIPLLGDPDANPLAGAIEAIAVHPTDPDILFAGTVNGGIWRTENARDELPSWEPLTDDLPSLAIGALAFSPLDTQVLYAGTGSFSSAGFDGGVGAGLYKSSDGGDTWTVLAQQTFAFRRMKSVVPTALTTAAGQVVLVGTFNDGGGVYRSQDGGVTFNRLSGAPGTGLPDAGVSHLVADPGDPDRYYVGIPQRGVYRSEDGGLTWQTINVGIPDAAQANSRIELAVHDDTVDGTHAVYAALLRNGQPISFYRSGNRGDTWQAMDLPQTNEGGQNVGLNPSSQGDRHFSLVADPEDPFVVFAGGDRQPGPFPNSIGARTTSGRIFRGDASRSAGSQWAPVTHVGADPDGPDGPAPGSAPHADSRDMVFDADGNLIESDDGGIYRLLNPNNNDPGTGRQWTSVHGNIRPTEMHSVAYDSRTDTIFGGTQDVGTPVQLSPNVPLADDLLPADGGVVAVDTTSIPGESIRYTSLQFFGFFNRTYWDANNNFLGFEEVQLIVNGTGGRNLFQFDPTIQFYQPFVLNAVDPTRMVIGTSSLYESFNRGDNLNRLGGLGAPVSALAYGGRLNGVDNPEVLYVAGLAGPNSLFLRQSRNGGFTQLASYPGLGVRDIALDPENWRRAYVVDYNNHAWATFNAGVRWIDITGDVNDLSFASSLRTIVVFSPTPSIADDIVIVGGRGGVAALRTPGLSGSTSDWFELEGLPEVVVQDMRYDRTDDVLVVGTLGRGAWTLRHVDAEVPPLGSPIPGGPGGGAGLPTLATTVPPGQDQLASLGPALGLPTSFDPRSRPLPAVTHLPAQPYGTGLATEDVPEGTLVETSRRGGVAAAEYPTGDLAAMYGKNVAQDFLVTVDPATLDLALADLFKWKTRKKSPLPPTVPLA